MPLTASQFRLLAGRPITGSCSAVMVCMGCPLVLWWSSPLSIAYKQPASESQQKNIGRHPSENGKGHSSQCVTVVGDEKGLKEKGLLSLGESQWTIKPVTFLVNADVQVASKVISGEHTDIFKK